MSHVPSLFSPASAREREKSEAEAGCEAIATTEVDAPARKARRFIPKECD
jgi:hypothetical protein